MNALPIIQMINICKTYGEGDAKVTALEKVDIQVLENEYVTIVGASGSGKSTLLNLIGCLDHPTSGKYILGDTDVSELHPSQLAQVRNQRIGFIFQSYNLLARTSALENVMLPMLYNHRSKISEEDQRKKARLALETVGLAHREKHHPNELSGGQMQRVAIARALVNDPLIILADEPTGNLDSKSGDEIMALIQSLHQQGRTIIMVTHDDHIVAYAQRVIRFSDGCIISDEVRSSSSVGHQPSALPLITQSTILQE